jgi:hypothetical protein
MKIRLMIILNLILLVNASAFAAKMEWTKAAINSPIIDLNDIRFTNRAQCALDSKNPTESFFVLINNVDAARSLYRLGKATGTDTNDIVRGGVEVYRYSVAQLIQHIHRKLVNRELPLLPADATADLRLNNYNRITGNCRVNEYCGELDTYLGKLWNNPGTAQFKIDNFNANDHYLSKKVFIDGDKSQGMSCHYLKKFSPLQAQLFGTKPTKEMFTKLAEATAKADQMLGECEDFSEQKNLKVAGYQFEIKNIKDTMFTRKWREQGFGYWNSLRLYFSWAWRNAAIVDQMAYPYANVLRGINLEESVIFTPTGCKSITPPKCDGDYLALNTIREMAKEDFTKKKLSLDVLSELPKGPHNDMMEDTFTNVNTDILDLGSSASAEAWLQDFANNLSGARGLVKNKLIKAVSFMNILTAKVDIQSLINKIDTQFNSIDNLSDSEKQELYYMCAEFNFTTHKQFSTIRGQLEILEKTTLVDGVAKHIAQKTTQEYYKYFTQLGDSVLKYCYGLKQKEIWDGGFNLDKTGFSPWYVERVYENKVESKSNDNYKTSMGDNTPYLSYGQYQESLNYDDVLCATPAHCARKVAGSIIDLFATAQYAATYFNLDQKVSTPDMFNPYAERLACKVYDPWYRTKSMFVNLFSDLASAALSTTTAGFIYADLNLKPGQVTSFRQLVKDGKISYDTDYDGHKVESSLISDFGPLLGVPCAVSISQAATNPYGHYRFAGITAQACNEHENNTVNVNSGSDIGTNQERTGSECISCALNFERVGGAATKFSPVVGTSFFLVRALVNLYRGFKDPFNIPRNWKANPDHVLDTYRRFGSIPKECVAKLRKGERCLASSCEEKIAKRMSKHFKGRIEYIDFNRKESRVKMTSCDKPVSLKIYESNESDSCNISKQILMPGSCKSMRKL